MQVTRTSPDAFTVAFESEEELREEHRGEPPGRRDLLERLLAGAAEKGQTLADRLRSLPRVQKIILATKADRSERAFLVTLWALVRLCACQLRNGDVRLSQTHHVQL